MTATAAGRVPATTLPIASGRESWSTVRELLRPRRIRLALTLAVLLAGAAAGLAGPLLLGTIVDRVSSGEGAGAVGAPAAGLLLVAAVQAALTGVGLVLVADLGQPMLADLRERVVERALGLPAEEVERSGRGDLLSRVGDDVAAVSEAVVEALPALAGAALTVVLTYVGLAALDVRLALAGLLALPLQLLAVRWYVPRASPAYADERAVSGQRAQVLLDVVGGAPTVRAFGLGRVELARVGVRSQAAVDAVVRTIRIATGFYARLNGAELVGTAAVLIAGFVLVRAGSISVGDATAGALLFVRLFDQFNILLGSIDDAQRALAALARLVGIARLDPPARPAHPARPADAGVRLRDVRHAYDEGHEVLHGVDLELAPGERVALVGVSGAGKSTLAKIVAGFHAPSAGTVQIGGADLGALDPTAVRPAVALVTQEVHVFGGTLADDLRLAAPDAADGRLEEALELAGALEWARRLPAGLDTVVGTGGVALTSAQAQQLALARLALAAPLVAVLDEATAEAGSAGARTLEDASDRVLGERTALVVAHRLTQAKRADRIVVLEDGRVAEVGTHDQLVAAEGAYAALWRAWSAQRPPSSASTSEAG